MSAAEGGLERRYRRLLSLYPRGYRELYEQEMLAVLLDGAEQGRSRPSRAETVDLVRGALAYRARIGVTDLATGPWRRAAGLIAVVAVAATAVLSLSNLLEALGNRFNFGYGYIDAPVGPSTWVPPVTWMLALVATLAGTRRVAAGLAGLALLLNLGVLGLQYYRLRGFTDLSLWRLALAVVAVAALLWTRDLRDGVRVLGWRRGAGLAVLSVWHLAGPVAYWAIYQHGSAWLRSVADYVPTWTIWGPGAGLLVVLGALIVSIGLGAPLRRRIFVVLVVIGLAGLVEFAFGGYAGAAYVPAPLEMVAGAVVTVVGFGAGAAVIRRRERARS